MIDERVVAIMVYLASIVLVVVIINRDLIFKKK